MNNQLTEFAKATEAAACKIFTEYGDAVSALQTIALVAPPLRPVSVALGLGQWAAQNNCNWDPYEPGPGSQCVKDGDGSNYPLFFYGPGYEDGKQEGSARKILSETIFQSDINGIWYAQCRYIDSQGRENMQQVQQKTGIPMPTGRFCLITGDPPPPVTPPAPYVHETEDGCSLTVNFEAWGQLPDGTAAPVFMIEPSASSRASGGVIGGCNFNPTIYYPGGGGGTGGGGEGGGGGGGPISIPNIPGFDDSGRPNWAALLDAALDGFVGAVIERALDSVLSRPQPGITYQMEAPCDKDEDGNPLVWEKEIPEADFEDAIGMRVTAIHEQISQALAWKTPICNDQPTTEGDFRTINFRSASVSPYSSSRLRKRFRYRSISGLGLGEVVDYWKDFTFESGPYRVRHVGSSWGAPEVWAATEDEGKRVIRHAAGEAGFDPDQVGRWSTRSSDSARLGVSDTMSVDTRGGFYRITSRDGSDGRPIVAA